MQKIICKFAILLLGLTAAAQPLPMNTPAVARALKPLRVVWDQSPSGNIVSNTVYSGPAIGQMTNTLAVPAGTNASMAWPTNGPAFFGVTATDAAGLESGLSNVLEVNAPATNLVTLAVLTSTNVAGPWLAFTNALPLTLTNPPGALYWRLTITRVAH